MDHRYRRRRRRRPASDHHDGATVAASIGRPLPIVWVTTATVLLLFTSSTGSFLGSIATAFTLITTTHTNRWNQQQPSSSKTRIIRTTHQQYSDFWKIPKNLHLQRSGIVLIEQHATACYQEEEAAAEVETASGATMVPDVADASSSPSFPWLSQRYIPQNMCSGRGSSSSDGSDGSDVSRSSSSLCTVETSANNIDLNDQLGEQEQQLPQLANLQEALLKCHFSRKDVGQIMETLNVVSRKITSSSSTLTGSDDIDEEREEMKRGMVDFLLLTLRLFGGDTAENDNSHNAGGGFLTTPVLLASLLHYGDCVHVQNQGLVPNRIRTTLRQRPRRDSALSNLLALPPTSPAPPSAATTSASCQSQIHVSTLASRKIINVLFDGEDEVSLSNTNFLPCPRVTASSAHSPSTTTAAAAAVINDDESCQEEILHIAHGASRIQRAELLARAVLTSSASSARRKLSESSPTSSKDNEATASRLRDFYLSVMDDWRSLAIRVVACCYRLEGLLEQERQQQQHHHQRRQGRCGQRQNDAVHRSITAREALYVYAPLAQRLGLPYQVKAHLEGNAFQLLYRRQYRAASALYETNQRRQEMQSISDYLLAHISQTLRQDSFLMANIQDLQIHARIKEPFSFWKKVVKKRVKELSSSSSLPAPSEQRPEGDGQNDDIESSLLPLAFSPKNLSLAQVNDGIALRVILKARCPNEEESEEITKTRERLLCYYVQHLIRAHWPETDESRLKDYIEKPKPNGYQSLHHTSKIISRGFEYPFEVQVRSEDMHHLAEFGLAAHWDYKLSSRSSGPQENATNTGGLLAPKLIMATKESVFPSRAVELTATDHVFTSNNGYGSALVLSPSPIDDDTDAPSAAGHVASGPYVTALIHAKEMLTNQVYVFVMDNQREDHGELISVPVGSRVVDAMAKSVNASSVATAKVWRNDLPAQLNETVLNGDVLMISL